jgi:signal transduction histidine kinase
VAARTGSLARSNEDLEAARARAEQADRSKSEFLANMSHEIRTPMNGVIGLTALLADTPLTTDQQAYVASIQSSGTALLAIINDILDFSKIEAGRLEIEAIDFDLHGALEDVIQLLDERAATKGVQLGVLMNGDVPEYVNGDPGRVRQVLLNLVATPSSSPSRAR